MTKEDFLLMLVRAELWSKKLNGSALPHELFVRAFDAAEKQTVTGLLVSAFLNPANGVRLDKYDAVQTYSACLDIAEENRKLNVELVALCRLLKAHDICFFVVKGATIGALYPHPEARMSGDIDFYLDVANFDRARDLIEREWHVTFEEDDDDESEQHLAFVYHGQTFEMHFCLLKFVSGKVQRVFEKMIAGSSVCYREISGEMVPVLAPVEELIYTFLHLYHHFIEVGVGLRQICDMAILLDKFPRDGKNCEALERWLERLDVLVGFRAFEAICVDSLGIRAERLPIGISPQDRLRKKDIMDVVFKRGNFGKYGRKSEVRSGMRYYKEMFCLKLKQYVRFYHFAPRESRAVLLRDIPRKVFLAVRRFMA